MQRKWMVVMLFLVLCLSGASYSQSPSLVLKDQPKTDTWTFEKDRAGEIAEDFTAYVGKWQVSADSTAPGNKHVFAQIAKNSNPTFNIALINKTNYRDVDISVMIKSLDGRLDQGGGLVWRARDAKNYYIARYNPLEDNYRVYKVVNGRRSRLQSASIKGTEGWHKLRVTMQGDRIKCYYDDKLYLDVQDSTFKDPGKIGLWTKADAKTLFDDLALK